MIEWKPGDRARISTGAFGDSQEPCDVAVRGKIGVLIEQVGDDLWFWRGDDGAENYPTTDELESVDAAGHEVQQPADTPAWTGRV